MYSTIIFSTSQLLQLCTIMYNDSLPAEIGNLFEKTEQIYIFIIDVHNDSFVEFRE